MESAIFISIVPVRCSLRKMAGIREVIQVLALTLAAALRKAIVEDNWQNLGLENARNNHFKHTVAQTTKFKYSSKITDFLASIIAEFKHGAQVSSKPSGITI